MEDKIYISEKERVNYNSLNWYFRALSNFTAPIALIFKELYKNRRIIFYTTKKMYDIYNQIVGSFNFYGLNIVFCSDQRFFSDLNWGSILFVPLNEVEFSNNDLFFAFDNECKMSVIEYVEKQPKNMGGIYSF